MSDVLKGARLAIGAAPVVLAVLFCLVRFAEWRWENAIEVAHDERLSQDTLLLEWGPGSDASQSDVDRYQALTKASE